MKKNPKRAILPAQKQVPPGYQYKMTPKPIVEMPTSRESGKLQGKVAIVTGGDSGIGQATAILLAKEGADIVVVYLNEHTDAQETKEKIEKQGRKCLLIAGDIGKETFCKKIVQRTLKHFQKIDILVNNAAEQHPKNQIEEITSKQLTNTFTTNFFGYFYLVSAAHKHLKKGSTIINVSSVTAFRGSKHLLDYSATKGAIVAFTRSLSLNLADEGIRVNGVAPGPIWTPLIVSTFDKEKVKTFGSDVPLKRPGQPYEVATCILFLASDDSSYITGQFLHPNGGEIVNT